MTVRLVSGPPGAGKNHYVEQHAKEGDYILDFDELRDMFPTLETARDVRDSIEASLKDTHSGEGKDAWVIRCSADPKKRAKIAERCGASEVVVVETPADVAKERVKERKLAPEKEQEIIESIDRWWSQYSMVQSDLIVKPETGNLSDREKQVSKNSDSNGDGSNTDNGGDRGYPADTPVADMTDAQQAAYWKYHSRKHENQLKELKGQMNNDGNKGGDKGGNQDAPDADAIREEVRKELQRENAVKLVKSEFKAAIAGRMSDDDFKEVIEDLNLANYVKEDGEVDTERITKKAAILAPERSSTGTRRTHQSRRENNKTSSVASGYDLYEEMHGKKK